MNRILLAAAAALALVPAASPAAADTFVLRDGTTLEGEVLRTFKDAADRVDRWEVRTLKGVRVLAVADVSARRPGGGPYPWQTFEEKFALIFAKDAEDNYLLGAWARERGLEAEAVRAFRRAVEADPDHAKARTALGHQRVGETWIVPPDAVTVPDVRGRPVPPDSKSPFEPVLGRVLARRESENYRVESTYLDQAALGRYLDALERSREATLAFLSEPPPRGMARPTYLLLRDAAEYRAAVDAFVAPGLESRADRSESARTLRVYREGHLAVLTGPPPGCIVRRTDDNETADRAFLAHWAVHEVWRAELPAGARDPDWLREAVAYSVLNDLFPDDPTYCVAAGYGRQGALTDAWRNTRTWAAAARDLAGGNRALGFRDLAALDVNSLSFDSLVQSWSVLQTLRAKDESGTRAFLRKVRRGSDPSKTLQECLRLDPAGVDRLWRAEMLRGR